MKGCRVGRPGPLRRLVLGVGLGVAATIALAGCDLGTFGEGLREATASDKDIEAEGAEVDRRLLLETPAFKDPALQRYVDRVGQRVAKAAGDPASIHFTVLDSAAINAYSIAGGHVYITRGLLAIIADEDELAFVLSHEVGHLSAGHTASKMRMHGGGNMLVSIGKTSAAVVGVLTLNPLLLLASQWGGDAVGGTLVDALSANYSRQLELDADRLGVAALTAGGYHGEAAARILAAVQQTVEHDTAVAKAHGETEAPTHGIFASHPDNVARLDALRQDIKALPPSPLRPPEADYLAAIDGLPYGDLPSLGTLRGNLYYSAPFGIVVELPAGWTLQALAQSSTLEMAAPGGTVRVVLDWHEQIGEGDAHAFAVIHLSGAELDRGRLVRIANHPGWRGSTRYRDQDYLVASWLDGDDGYLLVGKAARADIDGAELKRRFEQIATGLRPLRKEEAALAQPPAVIIYTVAVGDTWARLARDAAFGAGGAVDLRVLNRAGPAPAPVPGTRIKLIR